MAAPTPVVASRDPEVTPSASSRSLSLDSPSTAHLRPPFPFYCHVSPQVAFSHSWGCHERHGRAGFLLPVMPTLPVAPAAVRELRLLTSLLPHLTRHLLSPLHADRGLQGAQACRHYGLDQETLFLGVCRAACFHSGETSSSEVLPGHSPPGANTARPAFFLPGANPHDPRASPLLRASSRTTGCVQQASLSWLADPEGDRQLSLAQDTWSTSWALTPRGQLLPTGLTARCWET